MNRIAHALFTIVLSASAEYGQIPWIGPPYMCGERDQPLHTSSLSLEPLVREV
ncbi:MAG: hypothetical protein U0V87_16795 [Acidobacteriota bacterium]